MDTNSIDRRPKNILVSPIYNLHPGIIVGIYAIPILVFTFLFSDPTDVEWNSIAIALISLFSGLMLIDPRRVRFDKQIPHSETSTDVKVEAVFGIAALLIPAGFDIDRTKYFRPTFYFMIGSFAGSAMNIAHFTSFVSSWGRYGFCIAPMILGLLGYMIGWKLNASLDK